MGTGRLDRRPASAHGPELGGHPSCPALPGRRGVPEGEGPGEPRTAVRDALAVPTVRERPRTGGCPRCTSGSTPQVPCSARPQAGNGQLVRRRPARPRRTSTATGSRTGTRTCRAECAGVREDVGLFDQTSFAKFLVEGPDALEVLNVVSVADIDVAHGRAVYTQWCNDRGGIEADLTVNRLGDSSFYVVTSALSEVRDWAWLRRAAAGRRVTMTNITEDRGDDRADGHRAHGRCWAS